MAKTTNGNFTSKIEVTFIDEQWNSYIADLTEGAAQLIDMISPAELDDFEREMLHTVNKAEQTRC